MKIVFDHQIFALQSYGGISRYFVKIKKELSKKNNDVKICAPIYINNYVDRDDTFGVKINRKYKYTDRFISKCNDIISQLYLSIVGVDIYHETYFSRNEVKLKGVKRVLTVYDMIHELYPQDFRTDNKVSLYKKNAVDRADVIICISESTKNDLVRIFNTPESKIEVVYLAADHISNDYVYGICDIKEPYLLFIGNRAKYKNFNSLVKAYSLSKKLVSDFKLVCFGGGVFTDEELSLFSELGLVNERVVRIDGDDDKLNTLYKNATAFIYPSIYEGFGLPPLEAMANNCPVISSNTSSMPEVIGTAGVYFSPLDIEQMKDVIENTVYDIEKLNDLKIRGQERIKDFSWEKCSQKTLDVYKQVLKNV